MIEVMAERALYDYGTAVRCYNPKLDAWRVVWCSPVTGDALIFIARPVGE
jgi:hypothetical protein